MTAEEARAVLVQCDPYLTAGAFPILLPAHDEPAHEDQEDIPPWPPPQVERYHTRMFLTSECAGMSAQVLLSAIRRTESFALNLHGGRRRPGDIQACLERTHDAVDFAVIVLSIDTVIDPVFGYMMAHETFEI
eukprot:6239466-Pyramimonas_sp.AAC.1